METINHSFQVKSFIYVLGFHFIAERYVLLASAGLHFSEWFKSSWHLLVSMLNTLLSGISLGCHHSPFFTDVCSPQVSSGSKIVAWSSCQREVNCKGQLDFRVNGSLPQVKKIKNPNRREDEIMHSQVSYNALPDQLELILLVWKGPRKPLIIIY